MTIIRIALSATTPALSLRSLVARTSSLSYLSHGRLTSGTTSRAFHATPVALKKKKPTDEVEDEAPVKKGKSKGMMAADLKPASQSKVSPEAQQECEKVATKMKASVEWYRKEMAALENRAQGRVTPAILDGVWVHIGTGEEEATVKLMEVATVGVKEGTVLVVTVFDEHNLKAVEKAIYAANIPQVVPQKVDARTIRIPMPKPTIEGKEAFVKDGAKEAENTKKKIRAVREAGAKVLTKMGFDKWSSELKEMQTLTDKSVEEVDKILQRLKGS